MKIKLHFITFLLLFASISATGQIKSNLVFFTEQGERFTLILNGLRQNDTPETNVKVTDLIAPAYKAKIIFEDQALGSFDKNITFNQGTETTLVIKRNNKNEWTVRFMTEVPIAQALPPSPGQQVIVYNTNPAPARPVQPAASQTVTQTTTTVTDSYGDMPAGNVSMNIGINDPTLGVNFNVNVSGVQDMPSQMSQTTTTTTYSTTTSQGYNNNYNNQAYPQAVPAQPVYVLPGYNGPVGCPYPMMPEDFQSVKQSIASKSFDDTRLKIAKQVISTNCLLSSQVKEIMLLFTFEDTRLDLAKFAYGYTYDIGNFYKLNDAFTFESSIDELNEYIQGFRRY